jgi:uncharacterized membrane protein YeaQ/YmgE (transglycosylase-associated protein family)
MLQLIVLVLVLVVIFGAASSVIGMFTNIFGLAITVLTFMFMGWAAGKLLRGKGYGPIQDAVLGLVGGIIGSTLLGFLNFGGLLGGLFVGVLGAILVVFLVRLFHDADFAK